MKSENLNSILNIATDEVENYSENSLPLTRAATIESVWSSHQAYHELADIPVQEIDLIESVEANLAQLEELQAKMSFMMREVKYLLKL